MIPREFISPILSQTALTPGFCRMSLEWDHEGLPSPGQFLLVGTLKSHDPLLPRPFTAFRASQGRVDILYKVVGKGTEILASMRKGQKLRIIGPMGKGYTVPQTVKHAILVAGGMGIASLYPLGLSLKGRDIRFYFGAKTKNQLVERDTLKSLPGISLHLATEDGTLGFSGLVTELMKNHSHRLPTEGSCIYACGPLAMLKEIRSIAQKRKIPCQVSFETHMACGVGVCLGCAVPCREKNEKRYRLCCTDGPVFNAEDIIWRET